MFVYVHVCVKFDVFVVKLYKINQMKIKIVKNANSSGMYATCMKISA